MDYLSEVLKILDGALKANASMSSNYAGLLAEKLDQAGERDQANRIRERLIRAPQALASAQDAGRGLSLDGLPVDGESRLHTVDVSQPEEAAINLLLPSGTKRTVEEFLESVRHQDALMQAGIDQPNRMLLYGPPGTGKTQTARWIAAKLQLPLLTVRCDTLISSLLGQTSKNLRRVFDYAEGRPCVLFLDEFDALASARGNERDIGELQRVVISLLQNVDALPSTTIVLAATNQDQALDSAVWRRFGFRVPMPLPGSDLRELLWRKMLGSYVVENLHFETLVEKSRGASGALIEQVCLDAKRTAVLLGQAHIDETELFRRLALAMALVEGQTLATIDDEVRWLRYWDAKRFSLRELARIYKVSTRHINNLIREKNKNGYKGATGK